MQMETKPLLSSNLNPTTLRKLAWYFHIDSSQVDEYFENLPVQDEGEVIVHFSKYTRSLAGEDPEAPPDDALEERRFKQMRDPPVMMSGVNGEKPNAGKSLGNSTGNSSKRRKASSSTAMTAAPSMQFPIVEEGRKAAARWEDEWIMMTVLKYNKRSKVYILEDADDQAERKEEHEVPKDMVIPLASPEYSPPLFPAGSRVLAVFPGTTSFYPAVVIKSIKRAPSSTSKLNGKALYDYSLQFDDDEEDEDGDVVVKKVKGDFVIEEVVV